MRQHGAILRALLYSRDILSTGPLSAREGSGHPKTCTVPQSSADKLPATGPLAEFQLIGQAVVQARLARPLVCAPYRRCWHPALPKAPMHHKKQQAMQLSAPDVQTGRRETQGQCVNPKCPS
eukprot:186479-Amphidinium_carterae.4